MNNYYPDIYKKNIYEINYDNLLNNGIKCLLFDLDNTCVPYTEKKPSIKLQRLFIKLKDKGFKIIIFSNASKKRISVFKDKLNVDSCPRACKPSNNKLLKIIKMNNLNLSEIAIIGDQLLTDIYLGNKVGITTILVNSVSTYDGCFTKINRMIEKKIYKKMSKKEMFEIGEYYE